MDELLETVRAAAEEFYEVFGELGRESATNIWYLARDRATTRLVALRLRLTGTDASGKPDYELDVERELGPTLPVGLGDCPSCNVPIRRWARFCTHCGQNLDLGTRIPASPEEREVLAVMVRVAAAPGYEVLGEMPWDQGAGTVYFAIERTNGRLVRLRLKEDEHEGLVLKETTGRGIVPFAERLRAAYLAEAGEQTRDPPKPAKASVRTRAQAGLRERLVRTGALIVVLVAIIIILLVRRRT